MATLKTRIAKLESLSLAEIVERIEGEFEDPRTPGRITKGFKLVTKRMTVVLPYKDQSK